jgi:glycosyltransferase involved in cell wall biosynthesis
MSEATSYLLISPCRNEAAFMRKTLDSVLAQTVRPTRWVIVDDGSTDESPQILAEYAKKISWLSVVTRPDRGHRAVGPGVIEAFYAGLQTVSTADYQFICKLDLDLDLPARYFELLIQRMRDNPRIATCSGKPYFRKGDLLIEERLGNENSVGASKFYRTRCFEAIGGFVRGVMWDGIDCHQCRMNGWISCAWSDPELRFIHLRPMGSSQKSIYVGRMRHGRGQYFMGTGFLYLAASAVSRITERPYVLGSLAIIWGWLRSAAARAPRYDNPAFRSFLRRYHRRVLLVGKQRAIAELAALRPRDPAEVRPDPLSPIPSHQER